MSPSLGTSKPSDSGLQFKHFSVLVKVFKESLVFVGCGGIRQKHLPSLTRERARESKSH